MESLDGRTTRGTLYVFSGPSGAGKGTIRAEVFRRVPNLVYSISCTTREPRKSEQDGVDYRFITERDFTERVCRNEFLEWASVHGHSYGTLKSDVEEALNSGFDLFLEIDVQGAFQVKGSMPEAVMLFVAPPSIAELERRLRSRGTETEADLTLRLQNAQEEMNRKKDYDVIVVNNELEDAVSAVVQCINARRQKEKE